MKEFLIAILLLAFTDSAIVKASEEDTVKSDSVCKLPSDHNLKEVIIYGKRSKFDAKHFNVNKTDLQLAGIKVGQGNLLGLLNILTDKLFRNKPTNREKQKRALDSY